VSKDSLTGNKLLSGPHGKISLIKIAKSEVLKAKQLILKGHAVA
jgi:hypothetical protein